MPKFRRSTKAEIAPCIISQVRFALKLKTQVPSNKKACSDSYWNETVEIVGTYYNVDRQIIRRAKRNP